MSYSKINNLKEIINKKVLFLDLETTGIMKTPRGMKPENEYPDYTKLKIYESARIVSIGWIYMEAFDYNNEILIEYIKEHIITPVGFVIPNEAINIHGITNEKANNNGKEIKNILKKIGKIIKECDYIVGYNVFYDINVLLSELHRKKRNITIQKIIDLKEKQKIICIGQISSKEMKPDGWKQRFEYQIPKMIDVYKKCFNQNINNVHNVRTDVYAMIKIMRHIYENLFLQEHIEHVTYYDQPL
jgi:DNA polymerase III epsilon subunit-like protein